MTEIKYGEILEPGDDRGSEARVRGGFWQTLRKVLSRVPFAEDLVAAYFCAFDAETPPRVKGVLMAALGYFVLPLDIIPDFFAGIGFTDDLTVLLAAIAMVGSHIRPKHRDAAREVLADGGRASADQARRSAGA